MKLTRNHLKELIRQSIKEIDFDSEEDFKKYKAKHKMRGSTKVNIAGKDTTVDKADKLSKGDVGGPSYPNVPKGVKSSDDLKGKPEDDTKAKYAKVNKGREAVLSMIENGAITPDNMQNAFKAVKAYADWMGHEEIEDFEEDLPDIIDDGDIDTFESYAEELLDPDKKEKDMGKTLAQMDYEDEDSPETYYNDNTPTPKQIDSLNQKAEDGNGALIDTENYGMVTWEHGDPDEDSFMAIDQEGEVVELDYTDIVRFHNNDLDDRAADDEAEDAEDSGGPSYADVPKGAKSTKQANLMKKNDSAAKDLGYKNTEDLAMDGTADELGELLDSIPDEGQNFNEADEMINYIRDNEMGMRDDDDDVVEGYRKAFLSMVNKPGEKGGSGKSGKDIEKQTMKAADDANKKMDKAELKQHYAKAKKLKKELSALYDKGDREGMKKKEAEIKKFWADTIDPLEKKVYGESVIESVKPKRYTIKEVRTWMKTLEENRYKKVYNSDARRVAWMVNNEGVDLQEMPKSMRKKWTKAQYGRERYLAKEFLKSKAPEQKLRESIRKIINRKRTNLLENKIRTLFRQVISEKTVRISQMKDANFVPGQWVQLMGKKGMVKLTKKDVKFLAKWIRQNSGKHGMGWSFTEPMGEGKLTEAKTLRLPNGTKVKIDFKGITFKASRGKDVFLDRGELAKFFMATSKYLRY